MRAAGAGPALLPKERPARTQRRRGDRQLVRGHPRGCPSRLWQGSGDGPEVAACGARAAHPGPSLGTVLACLTLPCLLATLSGGHRGSMIGRSAGGESSPSQTLMQSAGEGPGHPGRPGRGPRDIPPPHGCLVSPIRSCPSACHLCAPVLRAPPLVCEAPTSRGGTASEGPASGGFWDLQKWC